MAIKVTKNWAKSARIKAKGVSSKAKAKAKTSKYLDCFLPKEKP